MLFINYDIPFHTNNCKHTLASPKFEKKKNPVFINGYTNKENVIYPYGEKY